MGQMPQYPLLGQNYQFHHNFTLKHISMVVDNILAVIQQNQNLEN